MTLLILVYTKHKDETISAIVAESTPFWITLAHELIHLKHKLEEINKLTSNIEVKSITNVEHVKNMPYSSAQTIGISDVFVANCRAIFPELSPLRLNMSELWPNIEERRTVIGPDMDGICEDSIRASAQIPCRFIYQDTSIKHLEKITILSESLSTIQPSIVSYIEEDEGFLFSALTPIDILISKNIPNAKITQMIDKIGVQYTTKNILRVLIKTLEDERLRNIVEHMLQYKNHYY